MAGKVPLGILQLFCCVIRNKTKTFFSLVITASLLVASLIVDAMVEGVAHLTTLVTLWYNANNKRRTKAFLLQQTKGEALLIARCVEQPYSYDIVAKNRGSTYFGTSEARWTEVKNMFGVREKGMWRINKTFLKQQIAAGKSFVLTADFHFGFLFKEISYITAKGASIF